MRDDRPSDTACYVAMGRAIAHVRQDVRGFDDPFALRLLPTDYRAVAEGRIERAWPRSVREVPRALVAEAVWRLIGPRTVDIDEGLRDLAPGFQLVIVGAGLDARAHRLSELAGSVVYEVDHPASQRLKRAGAATLAVCARELRYVAIDFAREQLDAALARAGHDVTVPTAWIFEGVISYLTPREVESSVEQMAARSAVGSRLLATYNESSASRRFIGRVTGGSHEPHRAWFSREEMRALLARHRFVVRSDRDGQERRDRYGVGASRRERGWVRAHHVVIADVEA